MVVYKYLILSITTQHTLFPMLTTAFLDRASLIPSKSPFIEDSKSKVSYIEKVKFLNFTLTQNTLLNYKMYTYLYRMLILSVYIKFKIFNHLATLIKIHCQMFLLPKTTLNNNCYFSLFYLNICACLYITNDIL